MKKGTAVYKLCAFIFSISAFIASLVFGADVSFASSLPSDFNNWTPLSATWQKTANWAAGDPQYLLTSTRVPAYQINDPYWQWTVNVWDGPSWSPVTGQYSPNPWAFWWQYSTLTQYWFRAAVYAPPDVQEIYLLNPYNQGFAVPINDSITIYVNGEYFTSRGSSMGSIYPDNEHYYNVPETGWSVKPIDVSAAAWVRGAWNDVWILAEETCYNGGLGYLEFRVPPVVSATIDINPDTLNMKSKGNVITCYIELPEGYHVEDINIESVKLSKINDDLLASPLYVLGPSGVGDYDSDGVPDLMVKFNRRRLISLLETGNVKFTVAGQIIDGQQFEGTDTIRVIE